MYKMNTMNGLLMGIGIVKTLKYLLTLFFFFFCLINFLYFCDVLTILLLKMENL